MHSFFYACEFSTDEEWQLQYDFWMDLRHSAWIGSVKEYANRVLHDYIFPDGVEYISFDHESRTPPELRPVWARPALSLTHEDFVASVRKSGKSQS